MSSQDGELPPKTAPLSEKLRAAMRGAGYESARSLGLALGMSDGSQVTKWLNGDTKRIVSERHLRELPRLLKTPANYFRDSRTTGDRLAALEATGAKAEDVDLMRQVFAAAIRSLANGDSDAALRELSRVEDH